MCFDRLGMVSGVEPGIRDETTVPDMTRQHVGRRAHYGRRAASFWGGGRLVSISMIVAVRI